MMIKKIFLITILFAVMTASCSFNPVEKFSLTDLFNPPAGQPGSEYHPWWEEAIFYEIFVRSFFDSDADGIGDFNGITQKLDYLENLGVNAIWLMPIHPSPSYHGYDVINYYAVNPDYGTMADFKKLLEEVHRRDMHLIIDLVLNHTSDQHPFFRDASSSPESDYRDWYIWEENHPGWGGNAWHEGAQGYYYGLFWGGMPDLNYNNPDVTAQMEQVIRYWVEDVGVDGFRLDAIKHLIEEDKLTENVPSTHEWLREFNHFYKEEFPGIYIVGEVFGAGGYLASIYSEDELDQVFNFELAAGFVNSANGGSNTGIKSAYQLTLKDMPAGNYATFLTNHDQNRVLSVLNGNVGKAKVAASLLLTAPGTPFIYYGEEIGLLGKKPDEDLRLPMQWSAETGAGFSPAEAWRSVNDDYLHTNVAAQMHDQDGLFSHYQSLIAVRKGHPALQTGGTIILDTGTPAVFAALRIQGTEIILILINLSGESVSNYALSGTEIPLDDRAYNLLPLLQDLRVEDPILTGGTLSDFQPVGELPPYSTYVFQIQ